MSKWISKIIPSFFTIKEGSTSHLGLLSSGEKKETALRCSEPLRSKVGGPKRSSPYCAGWDRLAVMGISLQLYCWKWVHGGGLQVKPTRIVPHCSIALHLSPLEWGILFLFYFWEDYLWRGAHQGYGRNLMTAIDHMFQNGTKEQCPIC